MTTPGNFAALGMSVKYSAPLIQGGGYLGVLDRNVSGYGHSILARGGYWDAQISITGRLNDIEEWYENGLGRDIQVIDQTTGEIFRGFVNQITLNAGSVSEVRGPLFETANRVSCLYTPQNVDVYPPIAGTETTTIIIEDVLSQHQYGIIEKVISAGKITRTAAEKERDLFLEENKEPPRTSQLSIVPGSAQAATISLDILGYIHWLKVFLYDPLTTGFMTVADKLVAIFAADPNNIFSSNTDLIGDNAFLVPKTDGSGKFAWDIIMGLLNIGHATNDDLMNFGCYENNQIIFEPIPTTVEYNHRLGDNAQRILRVQNNQIIYPWQVKPGNWLEVTDFLVSSQQTSDDLRSNERMKFLESIKYSLPWGIDLSGGKMDKLSQVLSKITYSGGVW